MIHLVNLLNKPATDYRFTQVSHKNRLSNVVLAPFAQREIYKIMYEGLGESGFPTIVISIYLYLLHDKLRPLCKPVY